MVLQPAPSPVRNQCTRPCRHTWTPCTQYIGNPISPQSCSKDMPHSMGKTSKLETGSWNIETATDILTESHTCLAMAKLCGLTHILIFKATQTGKCQDDINGILKTNSAMQISTLIAQDVWRYNKKTIKFWMLKSITFKTTAKQCVFDKRYMRTPKLWLRSSDL